MRRFHESAAIFDREPTRRRGDLDFQRWVNTFLFVNILNGAVPKAYEKWMGDAWKPLPAF